MRPIFSIILLSIGLLNVPAPGFAEVSLQHDRLTLHVQAMPLEEVLLDLSQEGIFRITILNSRASKRSVVSEQFDELPVEEGLERLLAGWKYGLLRHPEIWKHPRSFSYCTKITDGTHRRKSCGLWKEKTRGTEKIEERTPKHGT